MTDWKSAMRADPIPWLLETACAPIRYRVLTELLDRGRDDLEVQKIRQEALAYPEALRRLLSEEWRLAGRSVVFGGVSSHSTINRNQS